MKKLLIFGTIILASCQGRVTEPPPTEDTALVVVEPVKRDTANIGTWRAAIKSIPHSKGGKLTINGLVSVGDPKAVIKLTKKEPSSSAIPGELFLQISQEPKDNKEKPVKATYSETVTDISKYNKISIMFKDKRVAVIVNIERAK